MSSRCRKTRRVVIALALALVAGHALAAGELRVCADPDNLPYSDERQRGFENRIARVLADETGRTLVNVWQPLRRGFVRKTLGAHACDVVIGVPADFERVLTTRPYYRSSYVFVTPASAGVPRGFDDPLLKRARVGVQLIGNDLAATPPGYALARHGVVDNVVGYTIYGDGPAAARVISAIERGELVTGVLWGPQAGYFAARAAVPLAVAPAHAPADVNMPFEFDIAVGVRKGDRALRDELDAALARRRSDIDAVLAEYSVPRTDR
jgi:mxaJ protein